MPLKKNGSSDFAKTAKSRWCFGLVNKTRGSSIGTYAKDSREEKCNSGSELGQ